MTSSNLKSNFQSLQVARLSVLLLLLLLYSVTQVLMGNFVDPLVEVAYGTLAFGFLSVFIQSLTIEKVSGSWIALFVNVLVDAVLIGVWMYQFETGAAVFALFYLIQVFVVSVLFLKRGAITAVLLASLCLGVVCFLHKSPNGLLLWGFNSALFFFLGAMGGYLSERLALTTERLQEKSRKYDTLQRVYQDILIQLPTGMMIVDKSLCVQLVNPAAATILGASAESIVGTKIGDVEPGFLPFFSKLDIEDLPLDPSGGGSSAIASIKDESQVYFVHPITGDDQTRLQLTVEFQRHGQAVRVRGDVAQLHPEVFLGGQSEIGEGARVLLFQDVTRLLMMEDRLRQSEKLAAVGQLAAGIAHEIRNPLTSMSASIEVLKESLPTEQEGSENHRLMNITIREIDRLNNLLSEFLDFVRPEKIDFRPVDLQVLLSDVVLTARQTEKFKGNIEFQENYMGPAVAQGSNEKIRQVVWNLLVNARDAVQPAGVIEVGCAPIGKKGVRFWVRDTGAGMPKHVLDHLFEPFFTTKKAGTGLGLATAYKIVESHHGKMSVKSELSKGSHFEVILPQAA